MKTKILTLFLAALLLLVMLFSSACSGSDIEIKLAPIHEVEVAMMESYPVQVSVYIQMGLSDGCTTFHDIEVTRDGNTVNLKVTVQRPKDAVCTAVYAFHEEYINLGSDFTSGTTYNLNVNDFKTTFTYP